ncbi:MAG: TRAFs-binding domain-containing protein [Acidocella sp.]|nr:TRAFs-binding domain-containing protein [Acidocella sp.]
MDTSSQPDSVKPTETQWLTRIKAARRQGNHLVAFDLSEQALKDWPDALAIAYEAILALARAGALAGALTKYNKLLASGQLDRIADQNLATDFAGLGGRLFKDLAARSQGDEARGHRLTSAMAYKTGFDHFGAYYLAINAASMFLAAGHADQAHEYAAIAQQQAAAETASYWSTATLAEAALILGDFTAAGSYLDSAAGFGADYDSLASTRRQLAWVAALVDAPGNILDHLPGPMVLNWRAPPNFGAQTLALEFAKDHGVLAFGPLLSTADLIIARALLDAGAMVHVVLPNKPEILGEQVFSANPELRQIFNGLIADERVNMMLVTDQGAPFEPAASLLCAQQARGLALLRAQSLAVTPLLLVPAENGVTYSTMPPDDSDLHAALVVADVPANRLRKPHAILFGDVHGFSNLTEFEQLEFLEHIIGGFADVLAQIKSAEYAETAGDGLFIVLSNLVDAVECSFALHAVLPKGAAAGGLPHDLGMRISAHVGPLYKRLDRVIDREKFCGMEVVRTARIEPVTPVGEIYVTEQFATALACAAPGAFICEYVGIQPMAKKYGECRMYSLRRVIASP